MQFALLIPLLALSLNVFAHDHEKKDHHRKDHGTHEHGSAQMTVALDGESLEIELELPSDDVLGFEHAPKTKAEKDKANKAISEIKRVGSVVSLDPEAKCKLEKAEAEIERESKSHSEVHAHLHFNCKAPGNLETLDVLLFSKYKSLKKIRAEGINGSHQFQSHLTRKSSKLRIAK